MKAQATVWVAFAALPMHAAPADTTHDIGFLAEHVLESGMDAHYAALPWPGGPLDEGVRRLSVDLSAAETETAFIGLGGTMVAVASMFGGGSRWNYEAMAFYSDMTVSGGSGLAPLSASALSVPLDLPALAEFTNPRGMLRDFAVGGAFVRGRPSGGALFGQFVAGAMLERVDMRGFALDYRIVEGPNAGDAGVVDFSSRATFLTPFVSWQQMRRLGARWRWSPRALLAWPVPPGDFDMRMTGPGFDVSTAQSGAQARIGDPFAMGGLALVHARSGLEIDLGATVLFPAFEKVSHPGVTEAWIVHVAWRQSAAPD
jgi:hypothetical protein